jgi:hypothetical protein
MSIHGSRGNKVQGVPLSARLRGRYFAVETIIGHTAANRFDIVSGQDSTAFFNGQHRPPTTMARRLGNVESTAGASPQTLPRRRSPAFVILRRPLPSPGERVRRPAISQAWRSPLPHVGCGCLYTR